MKTNVPSNRKQINYFLVFGVIFSLIGGILAIVFTKAAALYTVPSTIASDCSVDVTKALNTWITSVPNGSQLQFGPSECYRIDGTLTLTNRSDLIFDGRGSTFKAVTSGEELPPSAAGTRSQWSTSGGSNLTFRNMIIRGANPNAGVGDAAYVVALEHQHAFNIIATRGVTIEDNQAYDMYGDFVYFGGLSPTTWAGNALVTRNHFERNGRQGISITSGDNITISDNYIGQVRQSTFDIEPNSTTGGAFNITVDHNTIGPGRHNFFSNVGYAGIVHDITLSNNSVIGKSMNIDVRGTSDVRRANFHIIGNVSSVPFGTGSTGGAVWGFHYVDGIEARNNTQVMQSGRNMSGMWLYYSTGLVATGNTFTNGTSVAILQDSTSTITTNCGNRLIDTGTFTVPIVCNSTPVPGDINGDGSVNTSDFNILAAHYGQSSASFTQGDINGDGMVSILDLSILASNW